jgi:hypothetical protein
MTTVATIMTKLAAAQAPLSLDDLTAKTTGSKRGASNTLARLCKLKRISMVKEAGSRAKYFLTPEQIEQWTAPPERQKTLPVGAGLTAAELAARLRFLSDISQRPAFIGHALLGDIITDYRRALTRLHDQDEAA